MGEVNDLRLMLKACYPKLDMSNAIQIYSRCSREGCDYKLVASEFGESSFRGGDHFSLRCQLQ